MLLIFLPSIFDKWKVSLQFIFSKLRSFRINFIYIFYRHDLVKKVLLSFTLFFKLINEKLIINIYETRKFKLCLYRSSEWMILTFYKNKCREEHNYKKDAHVWLKLSLHCLYYNWAKFASLPPLLRNRN